MPSREFKNPFTGRVRRTFKVKKKGKKHKVVEVYKPNPDPYSMSERIYIKDKVKDKKTALGFDKKSEKIKNVNLNARSFKDTSNLPFSNQKRVVFSGGKRRGDADDFGNKKSKTKKATNPFLDAPIPTEKERKNKKRRIAKRGGIVMGESRFRNQYD
tara:strand:- start:284 stop:754 length:471 start_codon:yes stop_codon:yes gene_type:complete